MAWSEKAREAAADARRRKAKGKAAVSDMGKTLNTKKLGKAVAKVAARHKGEETIAQHNARMERYLKYAKKAGMKPGNTMSSARRRRLGGF